MFKRNLILGLLFSIFVSAIGAFLIAFSWHVLTSNIGSVMQVVGALMSASYGVFTLACLTLAWVKPNTVIAKSFKYVSIFMFAFLVVASTDSGMISGQEFALILFVALVLSANYGSIRYVYNYRNLA